MDIVDLVYCGAQDLVVATTFRSPVAEVGSSPAAFILSANQRIGLQKRCSLEGEKLWRGKEGFFRPWTEDMAGDSIQS